MADCTIRTESKSWRIIALPNPTCGGEMRKALTIAEQEYQAEHGRASEWDNTFTISAADKAIEIRFELKEGN